MRRFLRLSDEAGPSRVLSDRWRAGLDSLLGCVGPAEGGHSEKPRSPETRGVRQLDGLLLLCEMLLKRS